MLVRYSPLPSIYCLLCSWGIRLMLPPLILSLWRGLALLWPLLGDRFRSWSISGRNLTPLKTRKLWRISNEVFYICLFMHILYVLFIHYKCSINVCILDYNINLKYDHTAMQWWNNPCTILLMMMLFRPYWRNADNIKVVLLLILSLLSLLIHSLLNNFSKMSQININILSYRCHTFLSLPID